MKIISKLLKALRAVLGARSLERMVRPKTTEPKVGDIWGWVSCGPFEPKGMARVQVLAVKGCWVQFQSTMFPVEQLPVEDFMAKYRLWLRPNEKAQ